MNTEWKKDIPDMYVPVHLVFSLLRTYPHMNVKAFCPTPTDIFQPEYHLFGRCLNPQNIR